MSALDNGVEADTVEKIDDPGEYKQKRRIKAILDARREVIERRRRALDLQAEGMIDETLAAHMLREAVEVYIMEVENQIGEAERTEHYWEDVYLGALYIEEKDEVRHFKGLSSIMNCDNPIVEYVTEETRDFARGVTTQEYRIEYQIPQDVLIQAFRVVNGFIFRELGMDVDSDDELPTWGFEEVHRDEEEA